MAVQSGQRRVKAADERRSDIVAAALDLFHERGFDATTVQHIAAAAGVAAGTVYLYFPSKEHVLLALHSDYHAGMQAALEAATRRALERALAGDAAYGVGIDAMIDAVVDFCSAHERETVVICRYLPRIQDEVFDDAADLAEYIGGAVRAGVDSGRIFVSDPEMTGRLLTAALREPLLDVIVAGRTEEIPRLSAQAKELFRKALAPQP